MIYNDIGAMTWFYREEYGPLEEFCLSKRLPVRNEIADEAVTYRESDDDGEKSGGRRKASYQEGAGGNDPDDDSESGMYLHEIRFYFQLASNTCNIIKYNCDFG